MKTGKRLDESITSVEVEFFCRANDASCCLRCGGVNGGEYEETGDFFDEVVGVGISQAPISGLEPERGDWGDFGERLGEVAAGAVMNVEGDCDPGLVILLLTEGRCACPDLTIVRVVGNNTT